MVLGKRAVRRLGVSQDLSSPRWALSFQAAAGKMGKVLGQYRDLPMSIIILPKCLWKNTAHSGGSKGVSAAFSALTLALAWKVITLGPPAQEAQGDPSDVPQGKKHSGGKPGGGHMWLPALSHGEGIQCAYVDCRSECVHL